MADESLPADAVALFQGEPASFTSSRNALVKLYRKTDPDLADRIAALRKPTKAAAMLNSIVYEHPDVIDRILSAGELLRNAQEALLNGGSAKAFRESQASFRDAVGRVRSLTADSAEEINRAIERAVSDGSVLSALVSGVISTIDVDQEDFFAGMHITQPRPESTGEDERQRAEAEQERTRLDAAVKDAEERVRTLHGELADAQKVLDEARGARRRFDQDAAGRASTLA